MSGPSPAFLAAAVDFGAVFEKARLPIYALNAKRRLVFANAAFWELTGLDQKEIADFCFEPGAALEIEGKSLYGLGPPARDVWNETVVRVPWPAMPDRCPVVPLDILHIPLCAAGGRPLLVLCMASLRCDEPSTTPISPAGELLAAIAPWESGEVKFVAVSPAGRQIVDRLELAARVPRDRPILITGEKGSGRSLAARLLHVMGRAGGPFVSLDLSLHGPDELNELLALSVDRSDREQPSIWDLAAGGTVVLEHGERLCAEAMEALRGLVGHSRCRVIVVTGEEPERLARRYGQDLTCWLSTVHVRIPSLRERREDIIPLSLWFVGECRRRRKRGPTALAADACERLLSYDWPGNVAQLREVVEAACARTERAEIRDEDLPGNIKGSIGEPYPVQPPPLLRVDLEQLLRETERRLIKLALSLHGDNKAAAAEALGLSRAALYRRMAQLGLEQEPQTGQKDQA